MYGNVRVEVSSFCVSRRKEAFVSPEEACALATCAHTFTQSLDLFLPFFFFRHKANLIIVIVTGRLTTKK
jgi:hypothetical protein